MMERKEKKKRKEKKRKEKKRNKYWIAVNILMIHCIELRKGKEGMKCNMMKDMLLRIEK